MEGGIFQKRDVTFIREMRVQSYGKSLQLSFFYLMNKDKSLSYLTNFSLNVK